MKRILKEESGQALIELSVTAATICLLIFGIVDFGRAIYDVQVMKNIAGEGSGIASTGTATATAAQTVGVYAGSDLNIASKGCVIVTIVTNQGGGTLAVTDQGSYCGISATSKIGCVNGVSGCHSSAATLPASAQSALSAETAGSSLAVTEIYYNYGTITPVGAFLANSGLPSQFYTAAFY